MKAIVSGNTDGETKKFLEDIGATDPEKLKDPKIQDILKARASTKIYLKNTKQLLDDNPSLKDNTKFNDSIKTLETNRSALGLSGSEISKNTGKLLNDIPKDPKEAIIGMVGSINKDSPNNTITRT